MQCSTDLHSVRKSLRCCAKKRRATTLVYPEPDAHLNNHPPTQWRDRLSGSAERASASPFRRSRRRTENRREEETKTAVSVTTTWCLKRRETVEQRLACEAHTHFLVRRSRPHRTSMASEEELSLSGVPGRSSTAWLPQDGPREAVVVTRPLASTMARAAASFGAMPNFTSS